MSNYCTFFDQGYLAQGLALWQSLRRHDAAASCWVLALDEETGSALRALAEPGLRVVPLAELLATDPELAAVQAGRPRTEFLFTLKPCFCRHVLRAGAGVRSLVYLDSDVYFFGSPAAIEQELGARSVLIVPHRFPSWHDEGSHYGRFNAGVIAFRDDAVGRACLERWRQQCLASCGLAGDGVAYGDQKYLDEWPERWGAAAGVSTNPGLNLAPWNWARHACVAGAAGVEVDGVPLIAFHFAQFRRVSGSWFDSGQLEYGVMPLRLRSAIYGAYWAALVAAETNLRAVSPGYAIPRRGWGASLGPWHLALLRLAWGQFWLKLGPCWVAGRLGVGQFSGRAMGRYRKWQRSGA
ncbi:MAG TPA: hypothetical protein VG734_18685 [Lacunisphaera sp.]|nr:hypothetical protein [Lacunisphaera sp.]